MIHHLVVETYGGKIDNEEDYHLLIDLVRKLLTPLAYDSGHKLVEDADTNLVVPEGTSLPDYMEWIHKLPEREPPTYLGLPANAEKLLLVGLGQSMIQNVKKVTDRLDDQEKLMA